MFVIASKIDSGWVSLLKDIFKSWRFVKGAGIIISLGTGDGIGEGDGLDPGEVDCGLLWSMDVTSLSKLATSIGSMFSKVLSGEVLSDVVSGDEGIEGLSEGLKFWR
jgi:hypothetical protein